MSNREKCWVCSGYTSDIREAFNADLPCPHCGALSETSNALRGAKIIRNNYLSKKADKELVETNKKLREENILLRDKVGRLHETLWKIDYKLEQVREEWEMFKKDVGFLELSGSK
jgi:hypothetical protein